MRFLLVEDDLDIAETIIEYFALFDCAGDYAMNGEMALELLHENTYDAVVLDINLPDTNGFEVCKQIRHKLRLNIPVIMLTARTMLNDKLEGFESGTDDYLPKPFELAELKMRLTALCRRAKQGVTTAFTVHDLSLDPERGTVERSGVKIDLPPVCFGILRKLMENYPGFVSKEELEYAIWKDEPPMTNSLKAHFYTLRQLVDRPFEQQLLQSVRGRGYRVSSESGDN